MVNVPAIEPIDHFGTSFPQHNDMALSPVYAAQKLDKSLTPSTKKKDSSLVVVPQSPPPKFTEEVVVPSGIKDEAIVPEFKAPRNQVPTYRQQSASAEFQLAPPALAVPDLDFLDNADWTSPFDLDLDFGSVFDSWDESHLVFGPPAHQQQAPAAAMAPVLVERRSVEQAASTTSSESEEVDEFTRNRRACLERYREKKRNRRFSKKVRYHLRKMNADRRPRYKGRFIKKGEVIPQELLDKPKSQQ